MPDEVNTIIVSLSVEEDRDTSGGSQDVSAAAVCTAKCPNCQQTCELAAGHTGLHHCGNGHEWV